MANYINTVLSSNEKILYQAKISLWSMLGWILIGLMTLPCFGLGLVFWLIVYVKLISTELVITDRRVIAKFGFISRRTFEISLNKVESIQVMQSLIGRICDYGSLVVSGGGVPNAPFPDIADPIAFRKAFADIQAANAVTQKGRRNA